MPPPALTPRQAAALDDDSTLRGCTRWDASGLAESVFAVQGMVCAACAGIIESALRHQPGVAAVEVNASSRRALVRWDPSRTRASRLVEAVQAAGYGAVPAQHESLRTGRLRESRQALWRLFVAGFCMMQVMMLTTPGYLAARGEIAPDLEQLMRWAAWVLSLPVLVFSAGPFFRGAWHALRRGRIGMDVPVALGIAITFVAGTGATFEPGGLFGQEPYLDSMTMFVTFLLAGRWLELRARERSTAALDALLQRLPDAVERLDADGVWRTVSLPRLAVGDELRIAAGQAFPGDGVIRSGRTQVDEALLSGESRPVERGEGDAVVAGSLNLGAPVHMVVERLGDATRHGQVVALLQQALSRRPQAMRLADRWAGPFLWAVLLLAAAAAAAWSVFDPPRAVWVAVSVLIVTCPCALSLATPAAWLAAAGGLARRGVLVQRLEALETLATVDTAVFDKTGTLTQDRLVLAATRLPPQADRELLLARTASLAALSRHPLSRALVQVLPAASHGWRELHEVAGQGVEAVDERGRRWRLGAPAWVGVDPAVDVARPQVACAPVLAGAREQACFEFDEALRPGAQETLQALVAQGLSVRMLSGDAPASVQAVAHRLGLAQAQGAATPEDKLALIESLQHDGHRVLMVGDGLNDGPVLARADVSFALAHGSAIAQSRSDFIVLGSRLAEVAAAHRLAQRCARVMRQNLAWAAAYNAACVPLALAGLLPPWAAGLGMAASSLFVVLNALRLSR
jgi:Cu2+-exporting ATPase